MITQLIEDSRIKPSILLLQDSINVKLYLDTGYFTLFCNMTALDWSFKTCDFKYIYIFNYLLMLGCSLEIMKAKG